MSPGPSAPACGSVSGWSWAGRFWCCSSGSSSTDTIAGPHRAQVSAKTISLTFGMNPFQSMNTKNTDSQSESI